MSVIVQERIPETQNTSQLLRLSYFMYAIFPSMADLKESEGKLIPER